jgi:cytochrome c oxidase cbb3-type subunit 3
VKSVAFAVFVWAGAVVVTSAPVAASRQAPQAPVDPASGQGLFQAQCGFCHGRDATGGASGPDLTDSELVGQDVKGDKIGPVIRNGRVERGMPPFAGISDGDLAKLVTYIHTRKAEVEKNPGRRRKVSVEDLSTGAVDAGRAYFQGAGGCAACHSATGDLVGIASKYRGLALLQRMLYPTAGNALAPAPGEKRKPNPATATVTLPSGETVTGPIVFRDEFGLAITDAAGRYRSWPTSDITFTVKNPVQAHADLLPKYTDADIHNLFAYLQTIK